MLMCLVAYLTALLICYLFGSVFYGKNIILHAFILNLLATLTIFLFSMLLNNSSMFDPYWSIAPPAVFLYWIVAGDQDDINIYRQILIMCLVLFWSVRLTWNWMRRWQGLIDEDWRYRNFRRKYQTSYWAVSFFGIHLFPAVIVFLGCISVFPALIMISSPLNIVDLIAVLVSVTGLIIETLSDGQLRRHLKKGREEPFLSAGLWKYSRHPNYFGEILFWTGMFIFSLTSFSLIWWTLPGPIVILLMFLFISVPMIDKRMLQRRRGYRDYYKKTSGLIPWFIRKTKK